MSEDHDKNCDPSWGPDLRPESSRKGKKKGKEGALNVAPIHGVLPFAGARNPLIRSNTARKMSFTAATLATDGVPQVYHFDSEAESAVALEALLHPDLYGLEVQLPAITYWCRRSRKNRDHHFDLRLTFRDGFRRAIFVRNGWSLGKASTQDEIDDIFQAIPADFADDAVVVNADHYSRPYRDNLRRIWYLNRNPDQSADAHVEAVARAGNYWLLKDLVAQCDLLPATAWQAAMRLIGRRILWADWHAVINLQSRVQFAG